MKLDGEGESIIMACACARILHAGDGVVVRKLQAALARVCMEYSIKCGGMNHERLLDQMKEDIVRKEAEVRKELEDG